MVNQVQGAASFAKNMMVLQAVAEATGPVSISDLAADVSMPRPTVYRLVAALEAEGLIEQTRTNSWQLGPRLLSLASRAWQNNDIRTTAYPFLTQLRDQIGETVHLAIPSGLEMTYIEKVESQESVRMTSTIGARAPFHSTSVGKAFLLALNEFERTKIMSEINYTSITKHSITTQNELEKQLHEFKKCGYTMEQEENELSVVCYGSAILNANHEPVAAISVSIPLFRLDSDHQIYTGPLHAACAEIGNRLPPFL